MTTTRWSKRIYRCLLRVYPRGFRDAYSGEMLETFERQRAEPRYRSRLLGELLFWIDILVDLSASATRRRLSSPFEQPRFPRKREGFMGTLLQDLKYAARGLRSNPGITIAALLTLAVGIGANTAVFSLVDGILLRPFPYPEPDRLVAIWDANPGRGWTAFSVSPPNFLDYRDQNTSFERMTAFYNATATLTGLGDPERLPISMVGPDYFQTFGIEPQLGRSFTPDENGPGNNGVAVLSSRLWQRRFGGDPGVVGQTITLNGLPVEIVGIFTSRIDAPAYAELWVPENYDPDNLGGRGAHYFSVIGRMNPGVTIEKASGELEQIAARLEQEYPDSNNGWTVALFTLHEERVGNVRTSLMMLMGAVAFVLLIACTNIANLLLARASGRQREISVRVALGAGRGRIFGQVISESLLLGILGGAGGIAVALAVTRTVVRWAPEGLPRLADVAIDVRVLGFTAAVSIATGLLFGVVPALQSARADVGANLQKRGRTASARRGVRGSLVVAEVAMAVVVVVGAGLLLRSLWQLQAVDPGFVVENRLAARIGLPGSTYDTPEKHAGFFEQLTGSLASTPGIDGVAATTRTPMGGDFSISFTVVGRPEPADGQDPSGEMRIVSPGYFGTLGIPLVRGRDLAPADRLDTPPVVLINRRLADLYFPDEDPIGQRMRIGYRHSRDAEREREIVGIVGDTREFGLGRETMPVYYVSYQQTPEPNMEVVLTTSGDTATAVAALRREVAALDADIPVYSVRTLHQQVLDSAASHRFRAVLLGTFAAVALLLASIGIYGVMAYSVAQRRRELGIRIALGAARRDVLSMVLRRGLTLAGLGIAIGSLAAAAVGRLLSDLLFGVGPADPRTFVAVVAFLLTVALTACYIPARRATRVDPTVAMRAD